VPSGRDATDQIGVSVSDPAKDKKRASDAMFIEDRQQFIRVRFDTALVFIPVSA
jgi:hypothetical protein